MSNIENKDYQEEPVFSGAEKNLYQAAYHKMQEKIDVSFYDPNKSFLEIEKKLDLISKTSIQKKETWIQKVSGYISKNTGIGVGVQASSTGVAVFAFGILFGLYVNSSPILEFGNKNNATSPLNGSLADNKAILLIIKKDNPVEFINLVVENSLTAGVEIRLAKIGSKYKLLISGLKPGNDSQLVLKALLGLDSRQDGLVKIELTGAGEDNNMVAKP